MMHFARAYLMVVWPWRAPAHREVGDRSGLIEGESYDIGVSVAAYRVISWLYDAFERVATGLATAREAEDASPGAGTRHPCH